MKGTPIPLTSFQLSPRLQRVTLDVRTGLSYPPSEWLPALVQMISLLPSSLAHFCAFCGQGEDEALQHAMCSLVRRCGSPLRTFETLVPLSETAILHLMQLPNLYSWRTSRGPPKITPETIFPSLEQLSLNDLKALPWVQFLASHGQGVSRSDSVSVARPTKVRDVLKSLECPQNTVVDSKLLSFLVCPRNLAVLRVQGGCPRGGDCLFHLTEDDLKKLVAALPRLKSLRLGSPCGSDACKITITSLMSISAICPDLEDLQTHFDAQNIARDMQRLIDGGAGRERAGSKLRNLFIGELSLELDSEGAETVAKGLKAIFPHLTDFSDCLW